MENVRLSLDQFKAKAEISSQVEELEKISGGVLGACHCYCEDDAGWWSGLCHAIEAVGDFLLGTESICDM